MSPASSGTLEVERYIGACLISQQRNTKGLKNNKQLAEQHFYQNNQNHFMPEIYHHHHHPPANFVDGRYHHNIQRCNSMDGWAGGMPLISFANHQRRGGGRHQINDIKQRVEDQSNSSPLARLAVHTQGAPLILTKSYNHRKNKVHRNNAINQKTFENPNKNSKIQETQNGADAVSVTSDESSGSANSENCLPRIIKPRKRRKKDRKPLILARPLSQDGFSTDSASPELDNKTIINHFSSNNGSFLSFNFDPYNYRSVPEFGALKINDLSDISETPKLHHSFEDIEELDDGKDINGNQPTSTCQCRYCDPSGQIWDVDRNCYSPFLTPPNDGHTFQFPNLNHLSDYFSTTTTNRLLPEDSGINHGLLVHCMSSVSLDEETEAGKKPLDFNPTRDLEVSTEIVTSLNGHRDLEIKFFSAAPSADNAVRLNDKSGEHGKKNCGFECAVVNNVCKFKSEE